jgi:hypothetical protein
MGYNGSVRTKLPTIRGLALRCGAAVALLALLVLSALRPAQAARTLDCRPGARYSIEGVGPPRTALLLLFDGEAVGGALSGPDGAYRIPLVVGDERPGAYPLEVVRRDSRALVAALTCVVPAPNSPAAPRPAATSAPAATNAPPPTAAAPSSTRATASATATRTPTGSPTATLAPGAPSPTATPTGSPTATATTQASNPTSQSTVAEFEMDDLDDTYYVGDDVSVVGTLLDSTGDGIANIAVTVRYTINGSDAGVWCSATTDLNGDWECPDKVVLSSWLNKTIVITAVAAVQGSSLTDSGQFTIQPDET